MFVLRWWIFRVVILGIVHVTGSSYGAMSIDFGSQFLKVGLIKPGMPMEIVLNKESHRKTPNVLFIRNNERLFGEAALAVAARYPASVYGHLLDLVAKHIDHPVVVVFRKRFPHLKMAKDVNGSYLVFPVGETVYPVETLLAMILSNVREFTEAYAETSIHDVVISVPVYFTQAERLAIEKATEIAKLNLLQLINDGTAAGLNYGIFRRKEITDKPQRLMIYDMGSAKTVASIVEYRLANTKFGKEPKMSVLGVGFDRRLGGLEMTLRLRDFLVEKFNENYKSTQDITRSERAMAKLLKEAERLKQVLSANLDHFAQIESVHEDIDMRVQVTRQDFNMLIDDLLKRVVKPMDQALEMAELRIEQIDQVVLMGAGTRVPKIQEEVQRYIKKKELGRFLNTDEAIAMGALYQAAHLSKGFKVKPFVVEDLVIFPIEVNFLSKQKQENGEVIEKAITRQVFRSGSQYPTVKKIITFTSYTEDFSFDLAYADLKHIDEQQMREFDSLLTHLSTISVTGVAKALNKMLQPDATEFDGIKVAFSIDLSGILRIEKAEAVIRRKSQGVVESITKTITEFFSKKTEEGELIDFDESTDGRAGEIANNENGFSSTDANTLLMKEKQFNDVNRQSVEKEEQGVDAKQTKEKDAVGKQDGDNKDDNITSKKSSGVEEDSLDKKQENATKFSVGSPSEFPNVMLIPLSFKETYSAAHIMSTDGVKIAKKILEQYEKRELYARERMVAENELESYAFEVGQLIEDDIYVKHSTEIERRQLQEKVRQIRMWMEEEVTADTKTFEFTKNHNVLKSLIKPIKRRIEEAETLGSALINLETMLNSSRIMMSTGGDGEGSLFSRSDTEAFGSKLNKLDKWLEEKKAEQARRQPHEDPVIPTSEVIAKLKSLERELNSFMKKMKQTKAKDVANVSSMDSVKSSKEANEGSLELEQDKKTIDNLETSTSSNSLDEEDKGTTKSYDDFENDVNNIKVKKEL